VTATCGHVLQVVQPVTGGVAAYVRGLTQTLLEREWRVTVACPPSRLADEFRSDGAELIEIAVERAPHPRADAGAVRAVAAYCRRAGVGVIHGHSSKGGVIAALAGHLAGAPSIYTPHCWSFEMTGTGPLRPFYATIEAVLARRFHRSIVAVAGHERDAAVHWHVAPPARVEVVPTGLRAPSLPVDSRDRARAALGLSQDDIVAAWVGRAHRAKGPERLVPLARQLAVVGVRVVALGAGLERSAVGRFFQHSGGVLLPETTPPARLLAAADILVQTSSWEGLPLGVLEAMRAGLPVVAFGVGGVSEAVADGRTGYVVEPGDVDALVARVARLAADPELRRHLGHAGRARAESGFDHDSMVQAIEHVYRDATRTAG
jgi:glycosyltransferase involved in cell wall biosynthesis